MPMSLEKRFDGNKQEVVEDARKLGMWRAMDKWGVKDNIAFRKFLVKETGEENIGFSPALTENSESLIDKFIVAFTKRVAKLDADNTRLREENEFLRLKLQSGEGDKLARMVAITEELNL